MLAGEWSPGVARAAVNHPFGSHPISLASGSIRPDHVPVAEQDQATRDYYDAWKARYLDEACGPGRYVVRTAVAPGNLTVSEGHGYGMLLAALFAGHDAQAKQLFDGMFGYLREHPSAANDALMSWNQRTSCADAAGNDTATDGDLDIAYALLLADKQWGSCGAIDYRGEALAMLDQVRSGEMDPTGAYPLLGDWVTPSSPTYFDATRSSDLMPDHFRSFSSATGLGDWNGAVDRVYAIVGALQTSHAPGSGLLPDFVVHPLGIPAPAAPGFLESESDGRYGYNACRDPWRLGTDFILYGDSRARDAVQAIESFFRSATGGDPARIRAGYLLDGTPAPGSDYLDTSFVAPVAVGAMVDASNQTWLNDLWDLLVARPIGSSGYYGDTLKLLAMVMLSGNWWAPELVASPACAPEGTPLCTEGGILADARVRLRGLTSPAGRQSLQIDGTAFFPAGSPVSAPLALGAQILVEDLGAGGTPVYELSGATTPVPDSAAGVCDGRDGWKTSSTSALYRNHSGALDPPICTTGTARGLGKLRFQGQGPRDVRVKLQARNTSLPTPLGPVRATLVLGDAAADGAAGRCAISTTLRCRGTGSSRDCR